ncbi:hypothetical protein PO124_24635 [Bacillus licheniformis]|nr:hypothetical protein [Bacillus licheniformis]
MENLKNNMLATNEDIEAYTTGMTDLLTVTAHSLMKANRNAK